MKANVIDPMLPNFKSIEPKMTRAIMFRNSEMRRQERQEAFARAQESWFRELLGVMNTTPAPWSFTRHDFKSVCTTWTFDFTDDVLAVFAIELRRRGFNVEEHVTDYHRPGCIAPSSATITIADLRRLK